MIKSSDNGGLDIVFDLVTHKLIISDTTLSSFIPPQVCKRTPTLRHNYGCDPCVIPKDMQIYLNRFIKILVINLQQKYVSSRTRNILFSTKSAAH